MTATTTITPLDLTQAPRVDRPERNYRVSRCCGAFAWKGSARPACPVCGGIMGTTTRQLRAQFTILEGETLAQAERLPGGLQADIDFERKCADTARREGERDAELIAQGSGVDAHGYAWKTYEAHGRTWKTTEYPKGSGSFSGGSSLSPDRSESIARHEAKAAKFERRLAKLGGAL